MTVITISREHFEYAGVEYPGAPNGRFDYDDELEEKTEDFIECDILCWGRGLGVS